MKLTLYSLAGLLLVGLASIMPLSVAQVEVESSPKTQERVVFVDRNALARAHPAWRALREMEATLAVADAASAGVSPHIGVAPVGWPKVGDAKPRVDRQELESEIRRDAVSSLVGQESEMRRALWLRSQVARENMLARAELDLTPKVREIEASVADSSKAVDVSYAQGHLDAQIKAGALRAIAKSPAISADSTNQKLEAAQSRLSQIEKSRESEKKRLADEAKARIARMREAEAARIDRWVEDYQVSGNQRIEDSILAARDGLCRDLGTDRGPVRLREVRFGQSGHQAPATGSSAGSSGELQSAVSGLRRQIAVDVERTIGELGRQNGVRVILEQHRAGVPDATKEFAALMRDGEWSKTGPVLCLARGR